MESVKQPKCYYCLSWKLLTEDGETGWCKIKDTWTNWKSLCKDYEIDPICLKYRKEKLDPVIDPKSGAYQDV